MAGFSTETCFSYKTLSAVFWAAWVVIGLVQTLLKYC
jgi:hypothetical protein